MNPDAIVPNTPPAVDPGAVRLAVVGECPGIEEQSWHRCASGHNFALEHWQNRQLVTRDRCPYCGNQQLTPDFKPFVGESGRLLNELLNSAGLPRERCFVGNVSRRPLRDDEKRLDKCQRDLFRLWEGLVEFKPNAVLCLGNLALAAFMGEGHAISNWRGSITRGELQGTAFKICAALHPAAVLREPSQLALLRFDVAKAVAEAATADLNLPVRRYWHPEGDELVCGDVRQAREREEDVPF